MFPILFPMQFGFSLVFIFSHLVSIYVMFLSPKTRKKHDFCNQIARFPLPLVTNILSLVGRMFPQMSLIGYKNLYHYNRAVYNLFFRL